jgi:hypothetical protein
MATRAPKQMCAIVIRLEGNRVHVLLFEEVS